MSITPTGKAPIRAVLETERGRMSFIFEPRERRRIMEAAMGRGGKYWIAVWMMKRFTKYAYFLGHRNGRRWNNIKRKQLGTEPMPFYGLTPPGGGPAAPGYSQINGMKMKDAVRAATVKASGINGREYFLIKVPYGHPIRTEDSKAFRKLPQREVDLIAKEIGAELERYISGSKPAPVSAVPPRIPSQSVPRKVGGQRSRKVG